MSTVHPAQSWLRDLRLLRIAVATFQPAAGVIALLCSASAVGFVTGTTGDDFFALLVPLGLVVGLGLVAVWLLARKRRLWSIVLAGIGALLAVAMLLVTVVAGRGARFNPHIGLWDGSWLGAASVLWWILIAIAAMIEWRLPPSSTQPRPPAWTIGGAVAVPMAVVTALTLLVSNVTTWEIRDNSNVSGGTATAAVNPSKLSGSVRWTMDRTMESYTGSASLVTAAGLAVPVNADRDHNAGVIMIDPVTGTVRWRYELRGVDKAPEVEVADQSRAIVVRFAGSDLPDDVPDRLFTLNAATGKIMAFWPDEVVDTDPPVLFHHVAQGTNSVSGLSVEGRKRWTFKPERCADPRGAASTPTVVLVPAGRCQNSSDGLAYQLHGFDARSGKQLWMRPWDDEDPPEQAVVRKHFQIEVNGASLQRRNLRTGDIDWTTPLPGSATEEVDASEHTLFIRSCDHKEKDSLAAYDLTTGKQLWQRPMHGQHITSLAAIDDQRALALTVGLSGKHRTCRAELLGAMSTRTLQAFPQDDRADDPVAAYQPGLVECPASSIYRVAGSVVLQINLPRSPNSNIEAERYRFIGLS